MSSTLRFSGILFLFISLTIISQIGGCILLLSLIVSRKIRWYGPVKTLFVFLGIYLIITFLLVPPLAKIFGREPLRNSTGIRPTAWYTIVLNRNYVKPEMNKLLERVSHKLEGTGVTIHYLDANFPFVNKFPLLPHLSHNDGRKLDLSLIYETSDHHISHEQKSNSGYGIFEEPQKEEYNQIKKCIDQGYFQYDYPKYLTMGHINKDLRFSSKGTKLLAEALLEDPELSKFFIEPHLKERLYLSSPKIRYHG